MRPELINASVLAYLGDSIFEVLVRDYLVKESGFVKPNDLQREAVKYVSASSHAAFMHDMLDEEFFSADEVGTYKRGRNTKGSKNESLDHMHSTGFEAVIGTLYLEENFDRIKVIFERYKQYIVSHDYSKKEYLFKIPDDDNYVFAIIMLNNILFIAFKCFFKFCHC